MDVLLIEQKRVELIKNLSYTVSPRIRIFYIHSFYNLLFQSDNLKITNSYIPEFIENYLSNLKYFETFGLNPTKIEEIIKQLELLKNLNFLIDYRPSIILQIERFKEIKKKLLNILNGKSNDKSNKLYFPLIEKSEPFKGIDLGLLETITVQIKAEKNETKFLITPSNKEIEKAIIEQIKTSWVIAVKYVSKYIKINPFHCVIIQFDHRYGEYVGDSLGVTITIEFIKELYRFYNSKMIISYNCKSAITGGVDSNGNIKSISKDIIEKKTEIVFYSDINCWILSEEEKQFAKNKLLELKKDFPNRELEIIGVEDINDLMNRRNIITISKEKLALRTLKFVKRNKTSFLLLLLLVTIIFYAKLYDFDNNPMILDNVDNILIVKNKNGKELWNRITLYNKYNGYDKKLLKIVDIDNEGINEVIINADNNKQYYNVKLNQTSCLDNKGNIIWKYVFKDSIETNEMVHSKMYHSVIIDTVTIKGQKVLAMVAKNEFYPSALYFLNLKTGKRIGPTMWHSGHMHAGLFGDFNEDGKKEIVMLGINNYYERNVLLSVNFDEIKGQLPTEGKYKFKNLPLTKVNEYILLPKSDVNDYYKLRFNANTETIDYFNKKYFMFSLIEIQPYSGENIMYKFDNNLKLLLIDPSDYFRVARDSLIAQGKLSLPYTGTREYKKLLKNQIRYWVGEKFVKAEVYFKK